jgi:hypothetical protein
MLASMADQVNDENERVKEIDNAKQLIERAIANTVDAVATIADFG